VVVHACNPSYSEGIVRRIKGQGQTQALSKEILSEKGVSKRLEV
jgi:hypothetical protein